MRTNFKSFTNGIGIGGDCHRLMDKFTSLALLVMAVEYNCTIKVHFS